MKFLLILLHSLLIKMLSCLPNEEYVIRSEDDTGFLHLSRLIPPSLKSDDSETPKEEWSDKKEPYNTAETYTEPSEALEMPTYSSISQGHTFFRGCQDILQRDIFFDVVIIPSGGMDEEGIPYAPVQARLDAAALFDQKTKFYVSSGAYTPLKPVLLNNSGQPVTEARSDAIYLAERYNITQNKLILEEMSKDTLGNAFFTRILCELMQFQQIVVITSQFHMLRTRAVFDWVFQLWPSMRSIIYFVETENVGMSPEEIIAREHKELQSLTHFWKHTKQKLSNMSDLTHFMYLGHRAYAFNNKVGRYDVTAPLEAFKFY